MNQKEFVQKSDEVLNNMSTEELRSCLHSIARIMPESKKESFLQLLDDCRRQKAQKGNDRTFQYTKLMPDEKVKDKLTDIKEAFAKIENGDLCLSAQGYEDYSNGYWASDWIWEYEDNEEVGRIIEEAALFARDCVNDCRYEEALSVMLNGWNPSLIKE